MSFISFAQNLEDVVLNRALGNIQTGFYVDVGANDPVIDSVTKAFYDKGWSGINIEPVYEYFAKLVKERPRDINLHCAVSNTPQELKIHVIPSTGLSTAIQEFATQHAGHGFPVTEATIPSFPLRDLIAPYKGRDLHFLKIDVEGMEIDVIRSMDLKQVRPWIIIIEAIAPGTKTLTYQAWEPLILDEQYEYIYFDGVNRYYLAAEHADLREQLQYPPGIFDDYQRHTEILANQKKQETYEEKIHDVSKQKESLETELNATRSNNTQFQIQCNSASVQIAALTEQYNELVTRHEHIRTDHASSIQTLAIELEQTKERNNKLQIERDSATTNVAALTAQYDDLVTLQKQKETNFSDAIQTLKAALEQTKLRNNQLQLQCDSSATQVSALTAQYDELVTLQKQKETNFSDSIQTLKAALEQTKLQNSRLQLQYESSVTHVAALTAQYDELIKLQIHKEVNSADSIRALTATLEKTKDQNTQFQIQCDSASRQISTLTSQCSELVSLQNKNEADFAARLHILGIDADNAKTSNILLQKSLDSQTSIIAAAKETISKLSTEIDTLQAAIQVNKEQAHISCAQQTNEIQRLRKLLYSASSGTHIYRAFHVLIGDRHYIQIPFGSTARLKRYSSLHAPWHTHLYRAGLGLFVYGEKPWHTHLYRSFLSFAGNPRYKPRPPEISPVAEARNTDTSAPTEQYSPAISEPAPKAVGFACFSTGTTEISIEKLNKAVERRIAKHINYR